MTISLVFNEDLAQSRTWKKVSEKGINVSFR